jgi:hypothetical protein
MNIQNNIIFEVWNIRDDDDVGEPLKKILLYTGDFMDSKNFVKNWLYKNKQNKYKYGIYYDSIYFTNNNKIIYHLFNDDYEQYINSENHYEIILDDENIFKKWKYIKN